MALALLAELTPLVVALLTSSALVHQATAQWDIVVAHRSARDVSPVEQQIHSVHEAVPFLVAALAALYISENPTGSSRWILRRKKQPLPAAYVRSGALWDRLHRCAPPSGGTLAMCSHGEARTVTHRNSC